MDGIDEYKGVEVIQGPLCHEKSVQGYGSMNGGVVFVGISPARDEVFRSRRPLTGPSGQMLNACLSAIDLDRRDFYCTNLVCTWKDEPSSDHVHQCSPRLRKELLELKPSLIILLGTIVGEIFTGRPFSKIRGAVQWNNEYNCYVMVTYHPSAIIRGMGEYGSSKDDKASTMIYDFIRDLRKIKDVVKWEPHAPESQINYRVVRTIEDAQNVLDSLPKRISGTEFPVALDVETDYSKDDEQVEVFTNNILCVGVGTDNYAWVFTPEALYKEDGSPALTWPNLTWTMHNAIFDTQVMKRRLGVWIDVKEDTMLQSYSLDERSGVHRLKTLAREYLGAGFYEDDRFYGKLPLATIPKEMLYEYNAKDVIYTARLCKKFREWQHADDVRKFYLRILIPAVNMYKETQYYGVRIDENLRMEFAIEWGVKFLQDEQELLNMAMEEGWDGEINLGSNDQLATFLFKVLSLPIVKHTRKGAPSVDKEVLDRLSHQHPFIEKLINFRKLSKMLSTYIFELPNKLKEDGRAHPIVKLHGTGTGRPSYVELAIQTFPVPFTDVEEFKPYARMRELIIPSISDDPDDPFVIVETDYGKAELWQAYSYSQDPQIYADLTSGDYHTTTAINVKHIPKEKVTSWDRVQMKRVSFGIMYDREAPSLSKAIDTDIPTAQEYINNWFKHNAVYRQWFVETQLEIQRTGELVSKTGRKRRIIILGSNVRALKQAVNFPIQSTSSDVVLDAAVAMHPRLKAIGSHILFTVHDSIVTETRLSRLKEHCTIMHDVMTAKRFRGVVRMPVEIKVGPSWGTLKGVHDCAEAHKPNKYNIDMGGHCLWTAKHYDYSSS